MRTSFCLSLALLGICFVAMSQQRKVTVSGKLSRVMAIGGESTGWAIELERKTSVDGKEVSSIEVASQDVEKLEELKDKRVTATGTIGRKHGVETGERSLLNISSIEEADEASTSAGADKLTGSEWVLEDLAGEGVIDNVEATLAFPEAAKVSGRGSCNRFSGPVQVTANLIRIGPLASTRMACPEALMNQETKYLNALQSAERFEWKGTSLLIYGKGLRKPLRFTRKSSKPVEQND